MVIRLILSLGSGHLLPCPGCCRGVHHSLDIFGNSYTKKSEIPYACARNPFEKWEISYARCWSDLPLVLSHPTYLLPLFNWLKMISMFAVFVNLYLRLLPTQKVYLRDFLIPCNNWMRSFDLRFEKETIKIFWKPVDWYVFSTYGKKQ